MPHLFTNRRRQHRLSSTQIKANSQFKWEAINAYVYLLGGLLFILGSVLFLPRFTQHSNLGVQIFIFGSLLYLTVTGHDFLESMCYRKNKSELSFLDQMEFIAAFVYLFGTLLFLLGSVLFLSQVAWVKTGGYCFIFGSILFLVGACINVIQVAQAGSMLTLQLQNATAITFITGSVIFVFASIPYLWEQFSKADQTVLFTLVGWEFIIGSVLFFLGGIFNFYRAYLAELHYSQKQ